MFLNISKWFAIFGNRISTPEKKPEETVWRIIKASHSIAILKNGLEIGGGGSNKKVLYHRKPFSGPELKMSQFLNRKPKEVQRAAGERRN